MKRILTLILMGMFFLVSCEQESESELSSGASTTTPSAVTLTLEGSGN